MISSDEPQGAKPDKSVPVPAPAPASPSRKSSISPSEPGRKRHTAHNPRDFRASHISYDSEAEARSVHGAVVSFAFKSHEIEPVPALPYGIYRPKLVGTPRIVSMASQQAPSVGLGSDAASLGHSSSPQRPLPPPKPSPGSMQLPVASKYTRPVDSPSGSSVVYGSDIIRRPPTTIGLPQRPDVARHQSVSTTKTVSHNSRASMKSVLQIPSSNSPGYTGPDLRHYSMGSQSATYETRDYLDVAPRATGLFRTSTFGVTATKSASRPSTDAGGGTPSRGSFMGPKMAQE